MAAFEMIESHGNGPTGTFTPRADQSKYVSTFACIGGEKKPGWQDGHAMRQGVPTMDGRAKITFDEYRAEGKDSKPNDIQFNGMTLREFIAPREVATKKEAYDAELSNVKMRGVSSAPEVKASATTVGMSKLMESDSFVLPSSVSA